MFKEKDAFDQAVMGANIIFGGSLLLLAAWHALVVPDPEIAVDTTEQEEVAREDAAEPTEEASGADDVPTKPKPSMDASADPTQPADSGEPDTATETASSEGTGDAAISEGAAPGSAESWPEEQMAFLDGDADAGSQIWNQCRACHVAEQEQNRVGPHLVDIIGRDIASIEGFRYSSALQSMQGQQWTPEELDAWLLNPREYAPGTSMSYLGVKDDSDRANLLAYLWSLQN